jgi:Tol biopolymer transport system component
LPAKLQPFDLKSAMQIDSSAQVENVGSRPRRHRLNKKPESALPGIFISYRRSDNPDATGRIYDRLVSEFGKAQVFKDVDSITLGQDFRGHLNGIVGDCGVVLAIIGPRWTDAHNKDGQRRLEDPDDFVRIELEAALARDIPVVPVLVGHAPVPVASELPGSLAPMAFRQSIEVRPDPDFHNDATRLVTALRGILDPTAAAAEQEVAAITAPAAATGMQRARPLGWIVATVLGIAAAAMVVPTFRHLRETPPPESRVDIVTPATDDPASFALSPDGRQIVFVAKSDGAPRLWLRSLAKAAAQPLAGTEGATLPFWSPDSRSIGFFVQNSLKRLDLDGGHPQTLAPGIATKPGSWSSKGVILFSSGPLAPISRVAASGGATTVLPLLGKNAAGNEFPLFLPDGQHFVFAGNSQTDAGTYLGSLDGAAAVRLTSIYGQMAYLPSGWLLWIRSGGTLVGQRLDVARGALVGEPVALADGVISVSASATGVVAYRAGGSGQRQLTWVDRSGALRGTVGPPDESLFAPRVSPDGRQVAFSRETQGKTDIWLQDDARASRMTFGSGDSTNPVWSPDGSRLAFVSISGAAYDLYQKPTNGAQAQEPLLLSQKLLRPTSWSVDGRYLLLFGPDPGPNVDLQVLPITGTRKPLPFVRSSFTRVFGQFSPDGRWVAYQSNESGQNEIYVRRFVVPGDATDSTAAQAGQWQVSTAGGIFPAWRADGKELFYIDPAGMMMGAPITVTGSTVVPGTPGALFQTNVLGGGIDSTQGRQYDVAPDGRFLINRVLDSAAAPITLIQNWNPDATKQ